MFINHGLGFYTKKRERRGWANCIIEQNLRGSLFFETFSKFKEDVEQLETPIPNGITRIKIVQ
jgi:hypothetical protein